MSDVAAAVICRLWPLDSRAVLTMWWTLPWSVYMKNQMRRGHATHLLSHLAVTGVLGSAVITAFSVIWPNRQGERSDESRKSTETMAGQDLLILERKLKEVYVGNVRQLSMKGEPLHISISTENQESLYISKWLHLMTVQWQHSQQNKYQWDLRRKVLKVRISDTPRVLSCLCYTYFFF